LVYFLSGAPTLYVVATLRTDTVTTLDRGIGIVNCWEDNIPSLFG